jgi:polyhydroxybutyrate depolymerase
MGKHDPYKLRRSLRERAWNKVGVLSMIVVIAIMLMGILFVVLDGSGGPGTGWGGSVGLVAEKSEGPEARQPAGGRGAELGAPIARDQEFSGATRWVVEQGSMERSFLVYDGQDGRSDSAQTGASAVIMVIHGWGGDATSMLRASGFQAIADREQAVVIAPEGVANSWNAKLCCGPAMQQGLDDIGFLGGVLEWASDRYQTDQVLVSGFSNGGMMSFMLGATYPDLVTAIAPVAGTMGGTLDGGTMVSAPAFDQTIPAYIVHGTADTVVPYDGGDGPLEGVSIWSAPESARQWAISSGCLSDEAESEGALSQPERFKEDDREILRYPCPDGGFVTLVTVERAGHSWIADADDIWRFFVQE